jgi:UDP-glucose:(glucosyl)LPS alpha-1,2-glucosyltransferase
MAPLPPHGYSGAMPAAAPSTEPSVAIVLPPRETLARDRLGAVGLIAHQFAATPGFHTTVIGGPQDTDPKPPFLSVHPSRWRLGSFNIRYAAAVAQTLHRLAPDLIEVHNRTDVALSLTRHLPHIPISLFLHNDPQDMRHARTPADRAALLDRFARIVLVSDYLRTRLLEGVTPPPRHPPAVIHNCIDPISIPPSTTPRDNLILFVGRIVADKGTDSFVAACATALPQLPGWRAEIIGADRFRTDSPETGFVRQVRAAATAAGVCLLGYQERPATLAAMARAAIVVMPSRWQEPFGLIALEAMACGATLICSARGGLPEVIGSAAVTINPDAPTDIAAAILALASDPNRRTTLATAGRTRAAQFTTRHAQAELTTLRHTILSESVT